MIQQSSGSSRCFTADLLIEWVCFLLGNLFISSGDQVARQKVGIPMGTSCAPFLASAIFCMYEYHLMTQQVSKLVLIPKTNGGNLNKCLTLRKFLTICGFCWDLQKNSIRYGGKYIRKFLILNLEPRNEKAL